MRGRPAGDPSLAGMRALTVIQASSNDLPAWLAFVGAIVVAALAALTAQWRLRVQLRSEEKRHREDLPFQRGETDRAELRMILDALATLGLQGRHRESDGAHPLSC